MRATRRSGTISRRRVLSANIPSSSGARVLLRRVVLTRSRCVRFFHLGLRPTHARRPIYRIWRILLTASIKLCRFYRDVLGLPNGTRDPLAQQPQKLDQDMSKFTATKGMRFRGATFRIPNAVFSFELTEFTGGPRTTVRPNLQDVGAATLALQVRDIESVLTRVKASGAPIVTIGGAPTNPTGNANSKLREIIVRDPDGFFVELQQPDPLPAGATNATAEILSASVQFSIEDSAKTVTFLRDAIGFAAPPTGALATNPVVANLIGLPDAKWRITHGSIPGTTWISV
jgi:catechol 2,3-dioxygenase-like lactoylglutathione lyase family enzyme